MSTSTPRVGKPRHQARANRESTFPRGLSLSTTHSCLTTPKGAENVKEAEYLRSLKSTVWVCGAMGVARGYVLRVKQCRLIPSLPALPGRDHRGSCQLTQPSSPRETSVRCQAGPQSSVP